MSSSAGEDGQRSLLGLDIGEVRIGVSLAPRGLSIAQPVTTVLQGDAALDVIAGLVQEHDISRIVAGWPRGLDGQTTAQTMYVEAFVQHLQLRLADEGVDVVLQDEALTSRKAEEELRQRGKPFRKEEVDALAATYILQDYLDELSPGEVGNV